MAHKTDRYQTSDIKDIMADYKAAKKSSGKKERYKTKPGEHGFNKFRAYSILGMFIIIIGVAGFSLSAMIDWEALKEQIPEAPDVSHSDDSPTGFTLGNSSYQSKDGNFTPVSGKAHPL